MEWCKQCQHWVQWQWQGISSLVWKCETLTPNICAPHMQYLFREICNCKLTHVPGNLRYALNIILWRVHLEQRTLRVKEIAFSFLKSTILGCNTVQSSRNPQMFHRNLPFLSSGSKIKLNKKGIDDKLSMNFQQTTWYYTPESSPFHSHCSKNLCCSPNFENSWNEMV
jgi:hypothetical protein